MNITGKLLFATLAYIAASTAVDAADLGGPKVAAPPPAVVVPSLPAASCFIGASVGKGAAVTRISEEAFATDFGSDGYLGGGEAGCDMNVGAFIIGGLFRYDWNNIGGKIEDTSIEAGGLWTIAARAGWRINSGTTIYGLAGLAGTKIKVEDVEGESHRGWVAGGGVEMAIANSPINLFAEYNFVTFKGEKYGEEGDEAKLAPDAHIVRVGGRLRF